MKASTRLLTLLIAIDLLAWTIGLAFVARAFGLDGAMILALIPVLPLIVAIRMRRRGPAVRRREFVFLALLLIVATSGVVGVVRSWYATGMDRRHAESVRYAEFGRALRQDPSFRDLEIHLTGRKHCYWVSGTVASKADRDRLDALATRCGIVVPLDGPYQHSVSIRIAGGDEIR